VNQPFGAYGPSSRWPEITVLAVGRKCGLGWALESLRIAPQAFLKSAPSRCLFAGPCSCPAGERPP